MPELPELQVYAESLTGLLAGRAVRDVQVRNVFTVRTADPAIASIIGGRVEGASRRGKRIVISLDGPLFLVFHLKLSGRLRWKARAQKLHGGIGCLKIDFDHGALHMTEASKEKSASVHVVRELAACPDLDLGVEPLDVPLPRFREALSRESRQLKSALTDQRLVQGIGNAYSDEVLFEARLSPLKLTGRPTDAEWERLHTAMQGTLRAWIGRVREAAKGGLPTEQGDWRKGMNVHGRFGEPCRACGGRVERIAHADSETHYCPACQTGGKRLSDRRMDRLLRR